MSARLWVFMAALALAAGAQTTGSAPASPPSPAPAAAHLSDTEWAGLYMARRDYPSAVAAFQKALKEKQAKPERAVLYNGLAIAYQQLGNLKQAERNYKNAHNNDKKNARYVNNLGTVYFMRRKYKDAAKQFAEAVKLDPTQAVYFVNLGSAQFGRKHVAEAMAAYREALAIDPESLFPQPGSGPVVRDVTQNDTPLYHYQLSRLFCSMGMLDDAVHQFRQAYDEKYDKLKDSLTDPAFAPLRARPEYKALMGLPPNPPLPAAPATAAAQ
jgi:Tfp pilus assembly protein PilF